MFTDPTMGPPDDMVDAANNYLALKAAVLKLAEEWTQDAISDEKYLNTSDHIGIGEGPALDAQIRLARMNAQALRNLVE